MSDAGDPAEGWQADVHARRIFSWLPLVSGAVVLVVCWSAMAAALALSRVPTCLSGAGLSGVADHVAFQLKIWDESGLGSTLALVIYAAVCLVPYMLLSGCVRLAARSRAPLFLGVVAIVGTAFVALYDALGFWAAYDDLRHGGFLCGFAFDLVPVGGVVAGACAATAGVLFALLIEWRWRARR
ncbi:MAG TPA: hypothetical protein VKB68_16295 [Stellaceae bacterium]|nr:hypothetical protein [Stellaceae bacterium]